MHNAVMKLKFLFWGLLFCSLAICGGCRSSATAVQVAAISSPETFPPVFKYSQIRDDTLDAAENGTLGDAPFFAQNYAMNVALKSGSTDKNLLMRRLRANSARNIRMVERVLAMHGYKKVAPEEANCVISICYGEGNRDGRRVEIAGGSPFAAANSQSVADSQPAAPDAGASTTMRMMNPVGGSIVVARGVSQTFKLGFLQVSCDLLGDNGATTRVWELTASKKQRGDFEPDFAYLAYGADRSLGRSTRGIVTERISDSSIQSFSQRNQF